MARYSQAQLIGFAQKAARRINRVLGLTGTDNEIVINATTGEMTSPDDEELYDIVLLQVECLTSSADVINAVENGTGGVKVDDGEQTIDTRGAAASRSNFFDSKYGPCAQLKEAILDYRMDNTSGRLIY